MRMIDIGFWEVSPNWDGLKEACFWQAPVRAAAATAVAHTAAMGGADVLGGLLKEDMPESDDDEAGEASVRSLRMAAALHGLSQCSDELMCPWMNFIVHRLHDPSPCVQHAAKVALQRVGSSCANALAENLSTEDSLHRAALACALGHVGPNALPYTNMLAKLLDPSIETQAKVRIAAADALCSLGPQAGHSAASALMDYLLLAPEGDLGAQELEAARRALVGLRDVTPQLLPVALSDSRPEIKCAALEICEALGTAVLAGIGSEVLDGIVECAACPDDLVRQRTVQALGVLSDPAIPNKVLPKLLHDASLLVSKMAVALAGKLGPPAGQHAVAVARHLTSFDPDLRRTAALSLGQLGLLPRSTAKDISATFKSEKREDVRVLLIKALGAQGAVSLVAFFAQA
ncbi:unnamed protein product [Symbiodinium natans]|uniref:Uncharacterized protein n=1 Tax=Symbiodinium natans TaxID=878477 RepID=A0A812PXT3_9DINO|nr:unnamed protein product [Symbiodinium natans]